MKKKTKTALIVGGALVLLGVLLMLAAWAMGTTFLSYEETGGLDYERLGWKLGVTDTQGFFRLDSAYEPDGSYTAEAANLKSLVLDWTAGEVRVKIWDGKTVRFSETSDASLTADTALRWGVSNGELRIQYCQKDAGGQIPVKNLTVELPRSALETLSAVTLKGSSADFTLDGIRADNFMADTGSGSVTAADAELACSVVNTASGNVSLSGAVGEVRAETVSGAVTVENSGRADALELKTTSGDITVTGAFTRVQAETVSGSVTSAGALTADEVSASASSGAVKLSGALGSAEAETVSGDVELASSTEPEKLQANTASGRVTLKLPADCGFTLRYDTSSGELDCGFAVRMNADGSYTCGSGACAVSVETTSGSLSLQEN